MYSSRKIDLEKTKVLQCERTVKDLREIQSNKVSHLELRKGCHNNCFWFDSKLAG